MPLVHEVWEITWVWENMKISLLITNSNTIDRTLQMDGQVEGKEGCREEEWTLSFHSDMQKTLT